MSELRSYEVQYVEGLVAEIERLTAEGSKKDAVIEAAQQLRKTLNSTLTQYTGDIFEHIRAMEKALDAVSGRREPKPGEIDEHFATEHAAADSKQECKHPRKTIEGDENPAWHCPDCGDITHIELPDKLKDPQHVLKRGREILEEWESADSEQTCNCKHSDAWRCAVAKRSSDIACSCQCHRPAEKGQKS